MSGRDARRIPLSARTRWAEAPSRRLPCRAPAPPKVDPLEAFRCEVSDTESEGPAESEGACGTRISTRLRRAGLRGLVPGPMGTGLVQSRMPGFGRGVPPSTRIELCVAVAFSEAESRVEGGRFFVLTTAHDGFNLTWLPKERTRDDPGWEQVALLPFDSVFSKHEGLAAKGPPKQKASSASADVGDLMQPMDVLGEELREHGWEGVFAFIFILAKYYPTPQNAYLAMEPESGQVSAVQLEKFIRKQIRQDVEALTGLKPAQLLAGLDTQSKGYISVEDLACSSSSQRCTCPTGSACISEVWERIGERGEPFDRTASTSASSGTGTAEKKKTLNLKWSKQANRRKELNSSATADGRSDMGSQTTRGEIQRRNELIRKERESSEVQDNHLDLERERFITTVQRTTVLHPLDYHVSRRAMEEMDGKRRLVQRLAAEAEAAFARKKGAQQGDEEEVHEVIEAPKPLLEIKQRKRNSVSSVRLDVPQEPVNFTSITKSAQAKRLAFASAQAQQQQLPRRQRMEVASLQVDPKRPRVAAGIGDGQLAVYYLFRSHGSKRKQLHQIQGFDASRGVGDVCTALCLPTRPLSDEGSMAVETVLGGFESGRVAVFRSFFPEDFATEKAGKRSLEEVMEQRQRIKSLANGEPVLQAGEPLLLEHFHCDTPIVALYWHQIMGIFSISAIGHVVVADSCGLQTFSIREASGRNSMVVSADLSLELEQLAVSGQRGVHLWQILSQAKYGVIGSQDESQQNPEHNLDIGLVRYMPRGKFILTLHLDGMVRIWDARNLELQRSLAASRRVSSAFWEPRWETLLIFSPDGVAELEIREDKLEAQADSSYLTTFSRGSIA